jgi:hypothetical protein
VLSKRVEPASGQGAADPLEAQGLRVVPAVDANLESGADPSVFFVAYPDRSKADKPRVGVEFLLAGKPAASQTVDLPAPDASGAIPMTIGTLPKPGDYELKITLFQGGKSVQRSIRYSIAAR